MAHLPQAIPDLHEPSLPGVAIADQGLNPTAFQASQINDTQLMCNTAILYMLLHDRKFEGNACALSE